MFRQLAKFAQPARQWDWPDPDDGSAASQRATADTATAIFSSSATTSATPSALSERDLRVSFNLLCQAIIRSCDPRLKAGGPPADARLLEDMRQKLTACESERLKLKSDLDYAHQCAHAYWDRCKSLKAELDHLNGGAVVPPVS